MALSDARPLRTFERLVKVDGLTIDALPGCGEVLAIAFASVGHDAARAPSPEFVGTATAGGRPALFVSDATRSWGRHPGLAEALTQAVALMRQRQPVGRILTLGQSMGGHMALAAGLVVPVDVVLAFGPQSRLEAEGPRWQPWAASAAPIAPPPPAARWTILLHGLDDDRDQALGFARAPGLDHILFPGLSHSGLVPHLKARGVLAGLVDSALAGDRRRLLRIAASAGGRRRLADQLPR